MQHDILTLHSLFCTEESEYEPEMPEILKNKPNLKFEWIFDKFTCYIGCLEVFVTMPTQLRGFELNMQCFDHTYYEHCDYDITLDQLEEQLTRLDKLAAAWKEFDPRAFKDD